VPGRIGGHDHHGQVPVDLHHGYVEGRSTSWSRTGHGTIFDEEGDWGSDGMQHQHGQFRDVHGQDDVRSWSLEKMAQYAIAN
jgi:hypothetical protein